MQRTDRHGSSTRGDSTAHRRLVGDFYYWRFN
jgi:hypothetical protein